MQALSERQSKILDIIIEEHIASACPVSSQAVFAIARLDVSCPTIRNEMANLTEKGYLVQPHTSAGRIPTEQGYRFFVDKIINLLEEDRMRHDAHSNHGTARRVNVEKAAKKISEFASDAVICWGSDGELRYAGLKKLFSNPEFKTREAIVALIDELERFENALNKMRDPFEGFVENFGIFIGSENPFFDCDDYSMIVSRTAEEFISFLGPMRMDYKHNISLLEKFL